VVIRRARSWNPNSFVADEAGGLPGRLRCAARSWPSCLRLRTELGLAALVVTHASGAGGNIADRVAVMYLGRMWDGGREQY